MERYGHFIDGKWIESEETLSVLNKYTGEVYAEIGRASREVVSYAVENAAHTFKTKKLSPGKRFDILMKAVQLFEERKEELAKVLMYEMGKVHKEAFAEIERGIQTFTASAEEAKRIAGSGVPLGQTGMDSKLAFTLRVPVGVIGAITPFNFPFNLTAHKIGPAIAAGNTVVLKPAEVTPTIACKLADILAEAGLPPGFLNVVNGLGRETGEYLLENEKVSMYTFTGSPGVGRRIKSKTGIRKVLLELGNNSPNIVHKDAPSIERAAELCAARGFSNAGQACISVQRIYVHQDVYDRFIQKAAEVAKSLKVGNPEHPSTDIGPMISEKEAQRAEQWVAEAIREGASLITGGGRRGAVLEPTILANVNKTMKVVCQEVFAPVISVQPYDDIEDAFQEANDSNMGLQVGLFTGDLNIALRAMQKLEFGGVIINDVSTYRADVMPYGGVKDSGIGKEGPRYAVEEMTEERLVVIDMEGLNK